MVVRLGRMTAVVLQQDLGGLFYVMVFCFSAIVFMNDATGSRRRRLCYQASVTHVLTFCFGRISSKDLASFRWCLDCVRRRRSSHSEVLDRFRWEV